MGSWSLLVAAGIFLVLVGLFTHWIVIAAGALLPVLPVLAEILRRRRDRSEPDDGRDVRR